MAELLMRSDRGSSFFWTCCALNGFSNRGFTSISSLAKQRRGPKGIPDESDGWIRGSHRSSKPAPHVCAETWKQRHLGDDGRTADKKNSNTTKREDRSLRGSEFKRKIRAEVEKAQTEDRKGSLLSVNLHHKTPWPLAAIKDLREVLMR